jgi:hypothetical protein
MPRLSFETTTLAPGTTAPDGSRTTPEIPATPAADWPNTPCAKNNINGNAAILEFM